MHLSGTFGSGGTCGTFALWLEEIVLPPHPFESRDWEDPAQVIVSLDGACICYRSSEVTPVPGHTQGICAALEEKKHSWERKQHWPPSTVFFCQVGDSGSAGSAPGGADRVRKVTAGAKPGHYLTGHPVTFLPVERASKTSLELCCVPKIVGSLE